MIQDPLHVSGSHPSLPTHSPRYGFRFRKPLDSLIKQHRDFARSKRPSEPHANDPAFIAVEMVRGTVDISHHFFGFGSFHIDSELLCFPR